MERRFYERLPYNHEIICLVNVFKDRELRHLELKCNSIDLSEKGISFFSDYPLEEGHVIRFNNGVIDKKVGVVKWSKKEGIKYKVGAMFV